MMPRGIRMTNWWLKSSPPELDHIVIAPDLGHE